MIREAGRKVDTRESEDLPGRASNSLRGKGLALYRSILLVVALAGALFAEPRRIVSTAPVITEILFALELDDRVVGVTTFCEYPAAAKSKPKIGTYSEPSTEAILRARPDLVIIEADRLWRSDLPVPRQRVLEIQNRGLRDVFSSIDAIAKAAGVPERGTRLNARIRADLERERLSLPTAKQRSVLMLLERHPDSLIGMTAVGPGTYLEELMQWIGARNMLADAPTPYPQVSMETILRRNPDVIIDRQDMGKPEGEASARLAALWIPYPGISAVRHKRLRIVRDDAYFRPGPRVAEVARKLRELVYGDAR